MNNREESLNKKKNHYFRGHPHKKSSKCKKKKKILKGKYIKVQKIILKFRKNLN